VARKILVGLAILVVVAIVAAAGVGVWSMRRPLPQVGGSLTLDVLDGPVDVYRDGFGVPHVYADTARDLFVAQGFVHAQDRFWEMDIRRHITAGRLSELFGASQFDTDRVIRTMGWRRVAEREWDLLSVETQQMFSDYADGVNAYLRGRAPGELSLEHAVLGVQGAAYEPERWSPIDSLVWLKAMAWDLRANMVDEIERVEAAATLPVERVEQLWPPYPFDLREPAVPATAGASSTVAGIAPDADVLQARPVLARLSERLAAVPAMLGADGAGLGSNAFVVGGDKTPTGMPLLANDPHLAASLPSIWYQMALHCRNVSDACPYAVTGVTFAGLPGVVIGHNERIAWGFTNLPADVSDLVLERVVGDGYEHAGRVLPLTERRETIRVAGGDDVTITVRETGHGPLVSDASEELGSAGENAPAASEAAGTEAAADGDAELAVALRWTALRPGRTADAIVALNRAGDWDEFRAAASLFDVPAQNIVYADVEGNIGYQAPGWIPVRAVGDDGRWPVPGWTGQHDWRGRVPFEQLPSSFNPEEGYIVTANQPVIADGTGPFFSRDHSYGWRSQRLRDMLQDAGGLEPRDVARIQMDARNGIAADLVPVFATIEVPDDVEAARALLDDWDLQQSADSAAAAYFAAVWRVLLQRTFLDELPPDTRIDGDGRWMEVVRRLLTDPDAPWWDDTGTEQREGRDDMLHAALVDAHAELTDRLGGDPTEWRWGDLHRLTLRHQTLGSSGIAPLERLFNRGPVGVGGGRDIVNATGWDVTSGYDVISVPSMRMVVDTYDWDASRWVNLTGASGHAFSSHYTDQVERWAQGGTVPMRWSLRAVRAAATGHLRLLPPAAVDAGTDA
jgi:penicillin amidase